jgi:hypothetical protein
LRPSNPYTNEKCCNCAHFRELTEEEVPGYSGHVFGECRRYAPSPTSFAIADIVAAIQGYGNEVKSLYISGDGTGSNVPIGTSNTASIKLISEAVYSQNNGAVVIWPIVRSGDYCGDFEYSVKELDRGAIFR